MFEGGAMGRKKGRIRYFIFGIIFTPYALLALIAMPMLLKTHSVSYENTTEITATVIRVEQIMEHFDNALIYTEEYGDKISLGSFIDLADVEKLYSLEEGDSINFRVENEYVSYLTSDEEYGYIDVVSLENNGYEILPFDQVIEKDRVLLSTTKTILVTVVIVFVGLATFFYVIFGIRTSELKKINTYSNERIN